MGVVRMGWGCEGLHRDAGLRIAFTSFIFGIVCVILGYEMDSMSYTPRGA
jgi:hypothetical protein